MNRLPLLLIITLILIALPTAAYAEGGARLVVSPDGPYTSIDAAMADAADGDVIEVRGGVYAGPLLVEKAITLEGIGFPIIDGGGQGTIVTLAAEGSTLRGFVIRGSGVEPDQNDAGILLAAAHTTAENNRLIDVLVGILIGEANGALVRGNEITGKPEYDLGRKGDGIRLWYSEDVIIEHNHIYATRDVVGWYSKNLIFRDNLIEDGRYGMHFMYSDGAIIERNQILNNSVGIYVMYTSATTIRENLIRGQRGPSGYALAFKDAYNVEVTDNLLIDNRAGLFIDGTPFRLDGFARYTGNIIAFNDVGVILQPSVRGNEFGANTFWENVEQVSIQGGGGGADANSFEGNYWSDYSGFDADGDGIGDLPYRSERLFESLYDREERLRALIYSPAVQALEFAATTFPVVRPQPKLTDAQPLMTPASLPAFASTPQRPATMVGAALVVLLIGLGGGALALSPVKSRWNGTKMMAEQKTTKATTRLIAAGVSKRYGKVQALQEVSFEAHQGEAIALWGPNGAGKSTLIKSILGLISFDGQIEIAGRSVQREGKITRSFIGYVPQEAVFYDWSVKDTMTFYARLKKADPARIPLLLEKLGLLEHLGKAVPALSGGLKQRLALAVALLSEPPVLLLDEPTANLDAKARRDYLTLLAGLRAEGKLIVFASHRIEELDALADHVLVMEGGRLIGSVTPEALRQQIAPEIELTLWIPEAQRHEALHTLESHGFDAHFNGRGTVVARLAAGDKARVLQALSARAIAITDFETEPIQWN